MTTSSRRTPNIVHIPDRFDTVIQKTMLREYAERHFPVVDLVRLDRANTIVDHLYVESRARRWKDPIQVRCFVQFDPPRKLLTKYGMEQTRKVLFQFTTLHLDEADVLANNDTFLIGDLVRWGGDSFEIKEQRPDTEAYWANTNIPFYIVAAADYYREGS